MGMSQQLASSNAGTRGQEGPPLPWVSWISSTRTAHLPQPALSTIMACTLPSRVTPHLWGQICLQLLCTPDISAG